METETERLDNLISGLRNIARFLGKPPSTLALEVERGEWPCATIGTTLVANPSKLSAAIAAKKAARERNELWERERRQRGQRPARKAREPAEAVG